MSETQIPTETEAQSTETTRSCPVCGGELEEVGEAGEVDALFCQSGNVVIEVGEHA
jgi:transcription initiation factor IIE alpha subunit